VFMGAPDLHREEPACSLLRAGEADWGRMYSSRRRPEPCEAQEVRRARVALVQAAGLWKRHDGTWDGGSTSRGIGAFLSMKRWGLDAAG